MAADLSITSPHPEASAAGMAVLRAGGTAIEAVLAAGAVLAVVTPHFCGLGGDAVWMVSDGQGAADAILAIGQGISAPAPCGPIPTRGPASIMTSAALVDGWQSALDYSDRIWQGGKGRGHKLPARDRLAALLQPAIALARDGYEVGKSQEYWGALRAREYGGDPYAADPAPAPAAAGGQGWSGFAAIFCENGKALRAGQRLCQPQLARSLQRIADHGPRDFYEGGLAGDILSGLRDCGVAITAEDLRRTKTRIRPALSTPYRDYLLLAPPPPTQGLSTLQIMAVLNRFDLRALPPSCAAHVHLLVEAVKQAFLERGRIADPRHMAQRAARLLRPRRIAQMAARISPDRALDWPHPYQGGDTAYLAASDGAGRVASVLQSTYYDWGSGVVAGDTGILWQNRGAAFDHRRDHPNAFAPGKLPFYTLNPGLALREPRPALAYGTQGADGQPQTLAMLLSQLIDFAASPEVALGAPRFLLGRGFADDRDSLKLEGHLAQHVMQDLAARGHQISALPPLSPIFGLAGVLRLGENPAAAHDPRGEGLALVVPHAAAAPKS